MYPHVSQISMFFFKLPAKGRHVSEPGQYAPGEVPTHGGGSRPPQGRSAGMLTNAWSGKQDGNSLYNVQTSSACRPRILRSLVTRFRTFYLDKVGWGNLNIFLRLLRRTKFPLNPG